MNEKPVMRPITHGPKFHWFGYYDKYQFDVSDRYVLGMEVDFEHTLPTGREKIRIGMVDLLKTDQWIDLGESRAWCWQQGCMLQWLPGSAEEIIWNDLEDDRYVSHILNVFTGKKRTLPHPVYTISPDGKTALGTDFSRIFNSRAGYGYPGIPDPAQDQPVPRTSFIYKMDLQSGLRTDLISLAEMASIPNPAQDMARVMHFFNHLLFSPDGSRFIFFDCWMPGPVWKFAARMFTADAHGKDIHLLDDFGYVSHFIWRDSRHILAWSDRPSHGKGFYLYKDGTGEIGVVGQEAMTVNGHCTYLPGNQWILNDTYPDAERNQELFLYHPGQGKKISLAKFLHPEAYKGESRCDLHPRANHRGSQVVVDAICKGEGRQMVLVDLGDGVSIAD